MHHPALFFPHFSTNIQIFAQSSWAPAVIGSIGVWSFLAFLGFLLGFWGSLRKTKKT